MPSQMADADVADKGVMPRVLLSYAKESSDAAEQLRRKLAESGYLVRSADDITPGGNVLDMLAKEVDSADFLVPLISRHYLSSDTATAELTEAISGSGEKESARIIPILLDGSAVMPPLLRVYAALDSSGSTIEETTGQLVEVLRSKWPASESDDADSIRRNLEAVRQADKFVLYQQYYDSVLHERSAKILRFRFVVLTVCLSVLILAAAIIVPTVYSFAGPFNWVASSIAGVAGVLVGYIASLRLSRRTRKTSNYVTDAQNDDGLVISKNE